MPPQPVQGQGASPVPALQLGLLIKADSPLAVHVCEVLLDEEVGHQAQALHIVYRPCRPPEIAILHRTCLHELAGVQCSMHSSGISARQQLSGHPSSSIPAATAAKHGLARRGMWLIGHAPTYLQEALKGPGLPHEGWQGRAWVQLQVQGTTVVLCWRQST